MLVFLECPSLSFQSFCLPHRLPLFLSYLPFYPIITLPMPRSHFLPPVPVITIHQWWEVDDVQWNQRALKCRSQSCPYSSSLPCLWLVSSLTKNLCLHSFFSDTIPPSSFFLLLPHLFPRSLVLSFSLPFSVSTASPCFSFSLLLISFVWVSLSLSLSLSDVFPLLSGGMKNFSKFYQRSSAFSPNTLHAGYWRLQHGPLLCATVLCELYQGIKHKLQTLHSTLSQLGTLHEELCQLTYSS